MSMTYPAALIDLHCDTLTATHGGENSHTLDDPRSVLALSRLPKGVNWCQCFAVFVPDGLTPAEGNAYYRRFQASFVRQLSVRADATGRGSGLSGPCGGLLLARPAYQCAILPLLRPERLW